MPPAVTTILEDITASIPGVVYQFLVGPDGSWSFPYVSKGIEELFEVTSKDACRDADVMTHCIIEEDRASHRLSVEYAVSTVTPWHHEHRILTRSGKIKWILATARPRQLEDGSVLWNGILTDISAVMEKKLSHQNMDTVQAQQMREITSAEQKLRLYHQHLVTQIDDTPLLHGKKLHVIIVEDDDVLQSALVRILKDYEYDVRGVSDGIELDAALDDYPADILVLDINLQGEDGIQIAQRIRQKSSCGIIMLTGRSQLDVKLSAYKCGADMFFSKPVDMQELHAAIENLGRRLSPPSKPGWYLDSTRSLLITPHNISIPLTSHQAIVLNLLCTRKGESVSRAEIHGALGQECDECADQRLETLLSRLRAKVRSADPDSDLPLRARQGSGYAFLDEVL